MRTSAYASVLLALGLILISAAHGDVARGQAEAAGDYVADAPGTEASQPETVAVAYKGVLYLYGNRLDPPYVFVIEKDTLRVNGVQFVPTLRREPPPVIKPTRIDSLEHQLRLRVDQEVFILLGEGASYDSVVARAAEIYRSSSLVDSLRVVGGTIVRYWKSDEGRPDYVTIEREIPPPPIPRVELLRNTARVEAAGLQDGHMLIWSEGQKLGVSRIHVQETEEQIQRLRERGWATLEDVHRFREKATRDLLNPLPLKQEEDR
jgi:hypothetical protein